MNLREAAQQALEAMNLAASSHDVMLLSDPPQAAWKARGVSWKLSEAISALRAALAEPQTTHWQGCEEVHPECGMVEQAIQAEREECAKVCEEIEMQGHALWDRTADPDAQGRATGAMDCAAAIRSRT